MISVVIVGIDGWEEYTRPLINGIWAYHPDMEVVVVDNASNTPYPKAEHIQRVDQRISYASAINYGIRRSSGEWILSLNNDVLCKGAFAHLIDGLDKNTIYSRQIITEQGHTWFGNWLCLVSRIVHEKIGGFDPEFAVCGFEDADYSVRGWKLSIPTKPIDLPFEHLWGKTRWDIPGYPATRQGNIDYFEHKHGWRPGENMEVIHD